MPSFSADQAYTLNKMNSHSFKVSLGDLIKSLCDLPEPVVHGLHTTVGTAAFEDIAAVGVEVGDVVHVTMNTVGAAPVTVVTAIAKADAITVTFSADPSTDHVVNYSVFKAS